MKKIIFTMSILLAFTVIAKAEVISLSTGTPVTSSHHPDGKNVTGTVTDTKKDGYADGRAGSSGSTEDPTNTRDKNWSVLYTDVCASEYKDYIKNGNKTDVNARLSAVEYELSQLGSGIYGYVDTWKDYGVAGHTAKYMGSTGVRAAGVVYGSTADLFAENGIGLNVNAGGLSNFSVNGAGVLTTYGGGYFDEAGQYRYNNDDSIDYIGHSDSQTSGFTAVQSGLVAFTTGFEMATGFDYINGTFAVMGELMGIYLNGTLLDSDLYYLSDDAIETGYPYAQRYDLEIDLTNKFIALLLETGNNNLSFAVLGIPHNYTDTDSHLYNDSMSFINFSADIMQNTISKNIDLPPIIPEPTPTPEPATLLIFGLGLAGLGLRRRFVKKG
jgi:hypothetical protein